MSGSKRLDLFRVARGAGLLLILSLLAVITFVPVPREAASAGQVLRAMKMPTAAMPGDAGGVRRPGTTRHAILHPEKWGPGSAVTIKHLDKEEAALDARLVNLQREIWAECLAATERRR